MSLAEQPVQQRLSAGEANERFGAGQQAAYALEARLARQYEASLLATGRRCVGAYRARTQVLTAAMPPKPEGDPQDPSQPPQPTVGEVLDAKLAAASAEARTLATRRKAAAAVAGEILSGFDSIPELRPLLEPLVRRQAGAQAERLVAGVRDAVQNVLLDALLEGWSVDTTAEYLGKVLKEQAKWRATMLARTDLIALSNGAAQDAVLVLGSDGPQFKTWVTAGDERVREDHQLADRQTVGTGEPFNVGGAMLQYPGDPLGPDSEIINCRCAHVFSDTATPVLRHSFEGGNLMSDQLAVAASGWDESKHPRNPSGSSAGGEFASVHEGVKELLSQEAGIATDRDRRDLVAKTKDVIAELDSRGLLENAEKVEVIGSVADPGTVPKDVDLLVTLSERSGAHELFMDRNFWERGNKGREFPDVHVIFAISGEGPDNTLFTKGDSELLRKEMRRRYDRDPVVVWRRGETASGALDVLLASFDPAKHPHKPHGKGGGQWARAAQVAAEAAADGVTMDVTETDGVLKLNKIVSEHHGEGNASEALDELVEYADEAGKPVFLNPSSLGGLTQEQLVAWYRRHGFVPVGKGMVHDRNAAVVAAIAPFLVAAAFDPAKHPRNPGSGRDGVRSPGDGGKFRSKGVPAVYWDQMRVSGVGYDASKEILPLVEAEGERRVLWRGISSDLPLPKVGDAWPPPRPLWGYPALVESATENLSVAERNRGKAGNTGLLVRYDTNRGYKLTPDEAGPFVGEEEVLVPAGYEVTSVKEEKVPGVGKRMVVRVTDANRPVRASGFDPSKHPRNPATGRDNQGSPSDGGKFASKEGARLELKAGGQERKLSDAQVVKRAQKVSDDLAAFYGVEGRAELRFEPEATGDWGTDARSLTTQLEGKPEIWFGQNVMDDAKDPEFGVSEFRKIAHESVHANLSGSKNTSGFYHDFEEGGAEVLSINYWGKRAQPFDERDATRVEGRWTSPGKESLAHSVVYREQTADVMRRAASRVGWDQKEVAGEVERMVKGDSNTRLDFRDNSDPSFAPPSGYGSDAVSLMKWLLS